MILKYSETYILRSYCSITTPKQGILILHCFSKITHSLCNTTIARYSAYPQRQKHSPAWEFKEVFDSAKIIWTEKDGAVRTAKPVDCPSGAADNGDVDRLGSRRARENSQRRNPCYWFLKSYLPTHGVCYKMVCRNLSAFADAPRAGSAEAKGRHRPSDRKPWDAPRAGSAEAKKKENK